MFSLNDPVVLRVLEASPRLFARHGFHRTSMAEVASKAGISRATLYSRFTDKMALFHALATALVGEALAGAEGAWRVGAALATNLQAMLLARDLKLYRLPRGSPHRSKLLSLDTELTRKHGERLNQGIVELIAARLEALGNMSFGEFQDAEGFARFLSASAAGLKHECPTEVDYLYSISAAFARSPRGRLKPDGRVLGDARSQ